MEPSDGVTELRRLAENIFQARQSIYESSRNAKNISETFIIKAFSKINTNKYFLNLSGHIYNQDPINNHLIQIIKEKSSKLTFNTSTESKITLTIHLYISDINK